LKVLLDENLDHRLRKSLAAHEVFTASYKGWDGLKNSSLLQAAEDDGFDVLVTGDQTLQYEAKTDWTTTGNCGVVGGSVRHHRATCS
jgi:hypothetical protein